MDHGSLRLLGAGAALDDLDPAERHAYEAHLPGCRSCRRLARELDATLADLAFGVPGMAPPATLRASVMGALRSTDERAARLVPVMSPVPLEPRRTRMPILLGLAGVLAIVVVGTGAWAVRIAGDLDAATARAEVQAAALGVIADPAHHAATLHAESAAPAATAVVVWRPGTTDAFVMADHLPPTQDGMVYQLWHADGAGVHPLGTFRYDGREPFLAPFGVDLSGSAAAMITLEPEGNTTGEPGAQVVFGDLAS